MEDWRGTELIRAGTARHALPPQILYEATPSQQNDDRLGEQGVTCLCLTRNRRDWLPKAIEAYLAQTYTPRELLIIADGDRVEDLVPERPDIRLIHIEEGRLIGDKRQFGVTHARGQYVAHWDDDDWSAPHRLDDQIARLQASGKALTGYSTLHFTDGARWWVFRGDPGYVIGTSMCYRRDYALKNPFPVKQIGEDGEFFHAARIANEISSDEADFQIVASVHGTNTSPRSFCTGIGKSAPAGLPVEARDWAASIK